MVRRRRRPTLASVRLALGGVPVAVDQLKAAMNKTELRQIIVEPRTVEHVEIDIERLGLQSGHQHGEVNPVATAGFEPAMALLL